MEVQKFCLQKVGEEYEDAFDYRTHDRVCSLAIADGATEASFSGEWAKLLVNQFVEDPEPFLTWAKLSRACDEFDDVMRELGQKWLQAAYARFSGEVPWYAQHKLDEGAFAAMLGVRIRSRCHEHVQLRRSRCRLLRARQPRRTTGSSDRTWEAFAVGDACLFHVREHEVIKRFPLLLSSQFNNCPILLCSSELCNGILDDYVAYYRGSWEPGDQMLLMTDALACWFMKRLEQGRDPLALLANVHTQEDFERFISDERCDLAHDGVPMLRNDDVTFLNCVMLA